MTTTTTTTTRSAELQDVPTLPVVLAFARRSIVNVFRVPGAVIPVLVMPLFFMLAFSGSFSGLARGPAPIVPAAKMIDWVLPYAILQGAAFSGMGATFGLARDLEGGFYDRIRLAPVRRRAMLAGPVTAALIRTAIPIVIVLTIGLALGGARPTDWRGVLLLIVGAEGIAVIAALWGLGIVYRLRSQRAMGLVQIGIFISMFLSSAQVPVGKMQGWLHTVARVNPLTNILRLVRQGFVPTGVRWEDTWGGLVAIVAVCAAMALFAGRGLRKLDSE